MHMWTFVRGDLRGRVCVAAAAVTATPRSTSFKGSSCGTVSAGFGTLCLPHTGVGSWRLPVPHVYLDTSSTRDKCVAAGVGLDAVLCVCREGSEGKAQCHYECQPLTQPASRHKSCWPGDGELANFVWPGMQAPGPLLRVMA